MTRRGDEHGWNGGPDRTESRIPLSPGSPLELMVRNPNGDVTVRATDQADVLVRAVKHGHPGSRRYDEAQLAIEVHNNRVDVRPRLPNAAGWGEIDLGRGLFGRGDEPDPGPRPKKGFNLGILRFGGDEVRYDLEIEIPRAVPGVPAGATVEVRTASGDVLVEDVVGRVNLTTASGDARLRGAGDDLSIHTASGDVAVERPRGHLIVRTASGDVRVAEARLERFALTSASGDVDLDTALTGGGPYRVESVSGDVRLGLALPPAAGPEAGAGGATVTFRTVSGDASADPGLHKAGRRTWHVGAPGGGTEVAVKTVSGDLQLRPRAWVGPAASGPVVAAPPQAAPPDLSTPTTPPTAPMAPAAPMAPRAPMAPSAPMAPRAPMAPSAPMAPMAPRVPTASSQPSPAVRMEPAETGEAAPGAVPEPSRSAAEAPSATESAPPPVPPVGETDRLAVLQALERGEIDVDQALNWLDADPDQERDPEPAPEP